MFSLFKKKHKNEIPKPPEIMGLRIGCSFEVDSLLLKLTDSDLVTSGIASTQIIEAVGVTNIDETKVFRFYTDDEAFLQVVASGGISAENVIDVKLFHYFDTKDISSDNAWNDLLYKSIGKPSYSLQGHEYKRVWDSMSEYHKPVHMCETTYDENGNASQTDQFTMLFEREFQAGETESVFLSAEESFDDNDNRTRCFVISTGISLTPSQLTVHG